MIENREKKVSEREVYKNGKNVETDCTLNRNELSANDRITK